LALGQKLASHLGHPIHQASAMSDYVFGDEKIYCTKLARLLGVKRLGPILGVCPITSKDS